MNISLIQIRMKRFEISLFIAALIAANLTLLFGRVCEPLVFFPGKVLAGEWWRVLTFPFVHVSLYHFLLDAGAFLLLYHGLQETSSFRRLGIVAACAAGSLGLALLTSPLTGGLCGLSGIAHGLMAVSAIELIQTKSTTLHHAGLACLLIVVFKSVVESLNGHVLLSSLHLGPIGHPVAICHTGGVLGGLCAKAISGLSKIFEPPERIITVFRPQELSNDQIQTASQNRPERGCSAHRACRWNPYRVHCSRRNLSHTTFLRSQPSLE